MALTIKKRCVRCMKVLREDGTCQNPKCSRYKAEPTDATSDTGKDTDSEAVAD